MAMKVHVDLQRVVLQDVIDWLSERVGPVLLETTQPYPDSTYLAHGQNWCIRADWSGTFYVLGPIQPYEWRPNFYVTFEPEVTDAVITEFVLRWN